MEKDNTHIVSINDQYGDCLGDRCLQDTDGRKGRPKGFVEVFEVDEDGNKKLVGKNNLVLYQGREWIAERIFNTENGNTSTDKDMFISWFGLGQGGAPIADPLTPDAPLSTDTGLDTEVPIHATDTNCADYRTGNYFKHPFDSVTFEQDASNNNEYLIANCTITIANDDANGYNINEAGLFLSDSTTGGHSGPFYLFARVTFPTIVKDSTRQLMFVWYIYT